MLKLSDRDELLKSAIGSKIAESKVEPHKHIIVARLKKRLKMPSVFKLVYVDGMYSWVDLIYKDGERNRHDETDFLALEPHQFTHRSIEEAIYEASSSSKIEEILLFEGSREFFKYLNGLDEEYFL